MKIFTDLCIYVLYANIIYCDCYVYMLIRDETILQYIDILQYLFLQYNTIRLKGNINILYIAIYCIYCNILQCLLP